MLQLRVHYFDPLRSSKILGSIASVSRAGAAGFTSRGAPDTWRPQIAAGGRPWGRGEIDATHLRGKDGGERKFLSETEGPEDLQNRSQPRQRLVIRQVVVRQPMRGAGEYLAQEGTSRLRRVQAVGPAAEGGGIGDAIGVFELWRRLLPGTVFDKASP